MTDLAGRPLSEQQRRRLVIAVLYGVTVSVERSCPSLERRGLMERYTATEYGVRHVYWRPTAAGREEAKRIQAEDRRERGDKPLVTDLADGIPEDDERDAVCGLEAVISGERLPCIQVAGHGGPHLYSPPLEFAGE